MTIELTDGFVALRQREKTQSLLDGEFVGGERVRHTSGVVATLHVRPVLARLHCHHLPGAGVGADGERVDGGRVDVGDVLFDEFLQSEFTEMAHFGVTEVEGVQPDVLGEQLAGDLVEVLLDARGELVVDERREVLLEQRDDGERGPCGNERLTLLPHVTPVLHRLDDRSPRRRSTDAEFLELLHDRRLGVARGWRSFVASRQQFGHRNSVAHGENGQQRFALTLGVVVARLFVRASVSGEGDGGAARGERAVVRPRLGGRHCRGPQPDRHGDAVGVGHL